MIPFHWKTLLTMAPNPWYHKALGFFQNNMCRRQNSPHCITIKSHLRGGGEFLTPTQTISSPPPAGVPSLHCGPCVTPPILQPFQDILLASTFITWESRRPLLSCRHANVNKTVLCWQPFWGKLNHCRGVVIKCRTCVWLRGSSSASLSAPELIVSVDGRPCCCVSKPQHRQSCFIPRPDARHSSDWSFSTYWKVTFAVVKALLGILFLK